MVLSNSFNALMFVYLLILLRPVSKALHYWHYIFSVNRKIGLELPKNIDDSLNFLIAVLAFSTAIYYGVFGLDLTFYFLLMGACYFIILKANSQIYNRIFYTLLVIFPIIAFLGYFTGKIALNVKSPFLVEIIFLAIFIATPPYIIFKLVLPNEKLEGAIKDYYSLFKKISSKKIEFVTKDLENLFEWLSELKDIHNKIEEDVPSYKLKLKLNFKDFEEKTYPDFKINYLNWFINGSGKKIDSLYRKKSSELFSEVLSLIIPEGIGGSLRESALKACWHAKKFIDRGEKQKLRHVYELEITKSHSKLLENLKISYLYISFYSFHLKQKNDALRYFNKYMNFLILEKDMWIRRAASSSGFVKRIINKLDTEIKYSKQLRNSYLRTK